jgi:hypothetical protein
MTYAATDPSSGFEPILAFANLSGGTQSTDDYSSTMISNFENANGTFNQTGAGNWIASVLSTLREVVLTEPASSTTYSDVIFSFMATVNGASVNAIALISDPTLVSDIMALNTTYHITPTASLAETGALQNVTTQVFATRPASITSVSVLSVVPEPWAWMLLLGGLGAVAFAYRRRYR